MTEGRNLRVGIVGLGAIAEIACAGFQSVDGIDVSVVCDIDADRADSVAAALGVAASTTDHRSAVARDDVDLVYVATPPKAHCAVTLAAIAAGKHVLCEKPLALERAEAEAMLGAAVAADVVHAVGHQLRYEPHFRHLRRLVADGFVGETRVVQLSVLSDFGTRPDMLPYYAHWTTRRADGGGLILGNVTHYIDLVRAIFGDMTLTSAIPAIGVPMRPLLTDSALLRSGRAVAEGPLQAVDTEDAVVAIGELATGGVISISSGWSLHHPAGNALDVYGSEGTLRYRDGGLGTNAELLGARSTDAELRALDVPEDLRFEEPVHAQLGRDLRRSFNDRTAPFAYATFADGLRTQQIVDAMVGHDASERTGA